MMLIESGISILIVVQDMMRLKIIILIWRLHHMHRKVTSQKHTIENLDNAILTRDQQKNGLKEPKKRKN